MSTDVGCDRLQFEVSLVDRPDTLAWTRAGRMLADRSPVSVSRGQAAAQILEFRRRAPQVLDDDVAVSRAAMVLNEERYRGVQVSHRQQEPARVAPHPCRVRWSKP